MIKSPVQVFPGGGAAAWRRNGVSTTLCSNGNPGHSIRTEHDPLTWSGIRPEYPGEPPQPNSKLPLQTTWLAAFSTRNMGGKPSLLHFIV